MANKPYLKDFQKTNIALVVTMLERGKQYPSKYRPDEMQYFYTFSLPDGTEAAHYASEAEERTLCLFNPGDKLQVVREERKKGDTLIKFNTWTDTEGAEARAARAPQGITNTAVTAREKNVEEYKEHQEEKNIQIALQGFMQAFIIQGKDAKEALALAIEARNMLLQAVAEIRIGLHTPVKAEPVQPMTTSDLPF